MHKTIKVIPKGAPALRGLRITLLSRGAPRQKYAGKGLQPSLLFRAYAACPGPIRFANWENGKACPGPIRFANWETGKACPGPIRFANWENGKAACPGPIRFANWENGKAAAQPKICF